MNVSFNHYRYPPSLDLERTKLKRRLKGSWESSTYMVLEQHQVVYLFFFVN